MLDAPAMRRFFWSSGRRIERAVGSRHEEEVLTLCECAFFICTELEQPVQTRTRTGRWTRYPIRERYFAASTSSGEHVLGGDSAAGDEGVGNSSSTDSA